MAIINRFEDLQVWKTARILNKKVYELSQKGSISRDFGFRDQVRRASVSVMSNIAEGFDSETKPYSELTWGEPGLQRVKFAVSYTLLWISDISPKTNSNQHPD